MPASYVCHGRALRRPARQLARATGEAVHPGQAGSARAGPSKYSATGPVIAAPSEPTMLRPACLLAMPLSLAAQSPSIDLVRAARVFQELSWASEDDGGRLWGRPLAGPTLLFDPATGDVVANQADANGQLHARDSLFVGRVARDFAGANTALDWAGVHWTVVCWPLPETTVDRLRLLLHESWHRLQGELGLPAAGPKNA